MSPRGGSSSGGSDSGSDTSSSSSSSSSSSGSSSSSSSGSSSSGSSYDSGYDDYQSNPWLRKTELPGSHFHNGYIVAVIVFTAIFMVALFIIGVWAITVRSRNRKRGAVKARKGGTRWALAFLFALFYQTYTFIDSILYESEVVVASVYILIETILISSIYIADILLLSAIFGLLHYCFLHPDGPDNAKRGLIGAIYWVHLALCGVLGALYISFLGLEINDIVATIGQSGSYLSYAAAYGGVPPKYKVEVAFDALCFVAAVEIVAAIAYLTATARRRDLTTKIGISMMGLIGAPLLIRRVFILAFSAAFNLSFDKYMTAGEYTADAIIEGLTNVLTYAGVLLAFKQLGELSWKPWDGNHQQPQIPAAGYDNPQAQSPPQMGRMYEPNQYQTPQQNGPISPYNIGQASPYDNHTTGHASHPVTMGHNY